MTDDEARALGIDPNFRLEPIKPDGNFHVGIIHEGPYSNKGILPAGRVSLAQAEKAASLKPFIGGIVRFMALRNKGDDPVFLPAIITRVWPDGECVGLRVFHSPAEPPVDEHWTICVSRGSELYQWSWPERA